MISRTSRRRSAPQRSGQFIASAKVGFHGSGRRGESLYELFSPTRGTSRLCLLVKWGLPAVTRHPKAGRYSNGSKRIDGACCAATQLFRLSEV